MSSDAFRYIAGTPAVYVHVIPGALDLHAVIDALQLQDETLVWLDSARLHRVTGRYSILGWDPWLTVRSSGGTTTITTSASRTEVRAHPLKTLDQLLRRYAQPALSSTPVGPGLLGWFSYELAPWIERLPQPKPAVVPVPESLWFGMRMMLVVDHAQAQTQWISVVDPHAPASRAAREAAERLEACLVRWQQGRAADIAPATCDVGEVEPLLTQPQFESMVHRAQAHIACGDIFQANLAHALRASWRGSPWPLYRALRAVNPSPFACLLQTPEATIVSCSPERLVRVRDGQVSARPIAGTRPRSGDPAEDLVRSLELILSDKERAEHLMLVDLARNDLGRVCQVGTVRVNELMALEDYSHVVHIVSNIEGRLRDGAGAVDVVRAVFPGGTITGCPKIRAMELIHELEPVGRGLYTGSAGYLGFDGALDLNILIRTIVVGDTDLAFHVGAGIVADSQPDREYDETLAKGRALFSALDQFISSSVTHGL